MNTKLPVLGTLLLALAATGAVQAQESKTREQVQAEWRAAQRSGNLPAAGESGLTLRELFPERYAAQPQAAGYTRAQVQAELAEAQRQGELPLSGEAGMAMNQAWPERYPRSVVTLAQAKTRAEVQAELAEARRNGDVLVGDSSLTLREEFPQSYPKARLIIAAPSVASR